MIPNGQQQPSPSEQSKRLYQGKQIAPLIEGQQTPTPMSAEYFNQLVASANAWNAFEVSPPGAGQIFISDAKVVLQINSAGTTPGGTSTVTTSGTNTGLTLFKPTSFTGADYYVAQKITSSNLASPVTDGVNVNIAKPVDFRTSITSRVIDGVTLTLDYGSPAVDNSRTSNDGSNSQIEVALPRFATGTYDYVYAMQSTHTGVVVSGVELTWVEVLPSRVWLRQAPPGT